MSDDSSVLSKRGIGAGVSSLGGVDSGLAGDGLSGLSSGSGSLEREPDVIVLDIGSGSIKVGWAGEDAPRAVIPTLLLDHHGQAMPAAALGLISGSGGGGGGSGGNNNNSSGNNSTGGTSSGNNNSGGGIDLERNEYAVGYAALQALHISSTKLATSTNNNLNLIHPVERGEIKVRFFFFAS